LAKEERRKALEEAVEARDEELLRRMREGE